MKKFIIGLLVGVSITAAGSAYADDIVDSIVGKTIQGQFPVKISGKSLDTQAAVIDGTSYLPVRAIGEALNMEVKFNADLGIELNPKGATTVPEPTQSTSTPAKPVSDEDILVDPNLPVEKQIAYLKDEISTIQAVLPGLKLTLSQWDKTTDASKNLEITITSNEKRLAVMKALLVQLQK